MSPTEGPYLNLNFLFHHLTDNLAKEIMYVRIFELLNCFNFAMKAPKSLILIFSMQSLVNL
jgi:hypothetical protein